jgi:hypothetical protein
MEGRVGREIGGVSGVPAAGERAGEGAVGPGGTLAMGKQVAGGASRPCGVPAPRGSVPASRGRGTVGAPVAGEGAAMGAGKPGDAPTAGGTDARAAR